MAKRYSLELVVVVVLFAVYALCAVALCVIGANIYRGTADTMRQNYDDRTSALYVMEKVRQNDIADSISVDEAYDSDALVLTERASGSNFKVWLFVKDGVLYEGVFAPDTSPDVAICQKIMPMQSMEIDVDPASGQKLSITFVSADGKTQEVDISCRAAVVRGA